MQLTSQYYDPWQPVFRYRGFDLAAERSGFQNVFQVEKDPWCLKVLKKNFPNVTRYEDITTFNPTHYANKIDLITGGFSCQPFSLASTKRKGIKDDRFLCPHMLRIIKVIKPAFVIGENVPGIIYMALDQVIADLFKILRNQL